MYWYFVTSFLCGIGIRTFDLGTDYYVYKCGIPSKRNYSYLRAKSLFQKLMNFLGFLFFAYYIDHRVYLSFMPWEDTLLFFLSFAIGAYVIILGITPEP